ncbi:MAG: InlB B-repeat-containing protein, partial [Clostridiales bacterium]|nr:InlB B-repeat-containing protein [Clostridiales bacterium]
MASVYKGLRLYANWTPKKYTLILLVGDEEFRRIPDITYASELTLLDVPTDLKGCTFLGWGNKYSNKLLTDSSGRFTEGHNAFVNSSGFAFDESTNTARLVAMLDYDVYDVTLNYNGLKDNQTLYITYNSPISELPEFEPTEGYEFIGWSYVNSYTDYVLYDNEKITEPITLYAIVLRYREFDIFDGEDNKLATKRVYDNGETIRLSQLELELPAGYQAGNWYNNSSMSGSSRITAVTYNTVTEALYVDIVPIEYTAQLMVGDATVSGDTHYTYTCEDIVPLPTAAKDNYSFLGWCTDEELTSAPVTRLQKGTTGNLTLYPKFKGVDVTLNLYPQNGGSQTTVTREYGLTFVLNVPTKIGYTFLGWYGSEEGGTRYTGANGKSSKAIDFIEPLNLYAQWIINEYTVSYVDGDGNIITSQTYEHGQKLAFPSDPAKEGLMFSGWYNADYSQPFMDGIKVTVDITVHALFVDSLEIVTADQLKAIAQNPSGNYHLGADINLLGETWTPINEFKGILDGKGHKIFNFGLALSSEARYFGFVCINSGMIKNLIFDDFTYNVTVTMTNDVHYGVVSGSNDGLMFNCTVNNTAAINVNITYSDLRLVTENFFKVSRV